MVGQTQWKIDSQGPKLSETRWRITEMLKDGPSEGCSVFFFGRRQLLSSVEFYSFNMPHFVHILMYIWHSMAV